MKTIFVPTDFSHNAFNAMRYAVALASLTQSKLVLFHAFSMPDGASEVSYPYKELGEEKKKDFLSLQKIVDGLGLPPDRVEAYITSTYLSPAHEIVKAAKRKSADLIIMGKKGKSQLEERLMGSVASGVVRRSQLPVIVVPEAVTFRPIRKVVLACEDADSFTKPITEALKLITSFFHSDTLAVKLLDAYEFYMPQEPAEMEKWLEGIPHHLEYELSGSLAQGLNRVAREAEADLLVVLPHRRSILAHIFRENTTRKLALDTEVPLLVLPHKLSVRHMAGIFGKETKQEAVSTTK